MPNKLEFLPTNGSVEFTIKASAEGRMLIFKSAVLARSERNKNHDEISKENILELAATLQGTPLDIDHIDDKIFGMFTDSRAVEDDTAVEVDGLIWMDRYPREASEVKAGLRQLSIEAEADKAECSICHKVFADADEYCAHLQNRRKSGASRLFQGMRGKGGGAVRNPAGSRTNFDPSQIRIIASHQEEDMNKCPHCQHENPEDADKCGSCHKNLAVAAIVADLNTALSRAEAVEGEKATLVASLETAKNELTAAQATVTEKETALTTKEQELKDKADALVATEAKVVALNEKVRQSRLSAHVDEAGWAKRKVTVMAMTDEAFEVYASDLDAAVSVAAKGGAGLRLPEPDAGGKTNHKNKEPLALGR